MEKRPALHQNGAGPGAKIAEGVAPGCKELGIMLPYTPLHHYLLRHAGDLLVMTSGNVTDEPILFEDSEALARLKDVADYFLVSNRPIFTRCDDSVVRANLELGMRNIPNADCRLRNAELNSALRTPHSARGTHSAILIRRARGYAPYPLRLASPFGKDVLACGAMLKNTFCIGKKHHAFLSPHIGDLENLETLEAFQLGIERFKKMLYLEPDIVAYDMHPDYLSTQYALGLEDGISKIPVQHHHAHVVSCMAENGLEGEVIGIAFDGLGYGEDGHLWGGEFLLASPHGYRRVGHLEYVPMPGGQKAIKEPWRMALSYLYHLFGEDFLKTDIEFVRRLDKGKWPTVKEMMDKKINSPLTSSMGRLFDGVSALLCIRGVITYEGQAAIELESASGGADEGTDISYPFELREAVGAHLGCGVRNILNAECGMQNAELNSALHTPHSTLHIGWRGLFEGILKDLCKGTPITKISSRFHYSVALMTGEVCKRIRGESGQERVVLSGGVFQNVLLLRLCEGILVGEGFEVYIHHKVPTNDGGLSLGQAVIADRRYPPPLKGAK
ncbi:MAG TPA: Kae1-like domain-containing protein [Candidatus Tripitaka californicus]|uniref:Kae1-like domain-containing protein n=1 Tax=Candidatus Tripitaka californicus TaxID=3367616 RepID=UPI0040297BDF